MRLLMRAFALLMAFVMSPGGLEALRDAAHFATDGHALHDAPPAPRAQLVVATFGVDALAAGAAPHQHDSHHDDEHRCSGTFHVCGCHVSPTFVATKETRTLDQVSVATGSARVPAHSRHHARSGVHLSPFRPPIA